jgi:hypothetical protein
MGQFDYVWVGSSHTDRYRLYVLDSNQSHPLVILSQLDFNRDTVPTTAIPLRWQWLGGDGAVVKGI